MWRTLWLGALVSLFLCTAPALAHPCSSARLKHHLAGQLVEYTRSHSADRRIWSEALHERRDLYVYLPPGFDPCRRYPIMLWLHGINQDEKAFVREALGDFDAAIACGRLPPFIIAIPDGSISGRATLFRTNPLFLNSEAGNFEDYVIHDVWDFMLHNYPICPQREAHIIAGYSGGGGAAYRLAIKYRHTFAVVLGLLPPLNVRWMDCHGNYRANFDPNCWGWREDVDRGGEVLGRFYGVFVVRMRRLVYPLFGRGPEAVEQLSKENPIEMIDLYGLREGELAMYVGYAGRDQFNLDAQAESFLYRARERCLTVTVGYEPRGRHDWNTARKLLPAALNWLAPLLAPFSAPCPCPHP
jgi:S-formylglutathione hydrolase FrmB